MKEGREGEGVERERTCHSSPVFSQIKEREGSGKL